MNNKEALFISVDGIDLAGKSTAVKYLSHTLQGRGYSVKVVRGMGSGSLGTVVRQHLLEQKLNPTTIATACGLALLDCYSCVQSYLDQGHTVLADRSIATYYAYNLKANKDPGAIEIFHSILMNEEIVKAVPDLSIIVDVDLDVAKERLANRTDEITHIDERSVEYFKQVAKGYYEYFEYGSSHTRSRFKLVNNNDSMINFKQRIIDALELIGE